MHINCSTWNISNFVVKKYNVPRGTYFEIMKKLNF